MLCWSAGSVGGWWNMLYPGAEPSAPPRVRNNASASVGLHPHLVEHRVQAQKDYLSTATAPVRKEGRFVHDFLYVGGFQGRAILSCRCPSAVDAFPHRPVRASPSA